MRRTLIVAAIALGIGLPAAGAATSRVTLTLQPSAFKVLFGHPIMLSGRVAGKPAGTPITVFAWPFGKSSPVRLATLRTEAGGRFHFSVRPTIQTTYKIEHASILSRGVRVGVVPAVSLTELGDGSLLGSVRIGHSLASRSVALQQLSGGSWQTIRQATLTTGSTATFAPATPFGRAPIRLSLSVNQAGPGYLGGVSHPLKYQAFTLTLVPSTVKVLFGHSVTLGGRLWNGHAGVPITIQAWPYGRSAPIRVATVTTGTNGAWSVRAVPTILTSYQARWMSHVTPRVRVGVAPAIAIKRLSGHRIWTQVRLGKSLAGRTVELQQQVGSGSWQNVAQMQLGRASSAVFRVTLTAPSTVVRVAMSINEAGTGYLASASRTLVYRP